MREFVNLVDTVASSYLRGIRLLIVGGLVLAVIVFLFLAYTAPVVVEEVGERAESISDKAIEAAREEQRAAAMADEGWGYSDTTASSAESRAADFAETSGDDWGTPSD
jgi:hypothetical protein